MLRVLMLYSSTDGHTRCICERLRAVIGAQGPRVELMALTDCTGEALANSDAVVIGASIRYGKHKPEVGAFIDRHQRALEARPNAFFSVNVVARKPGKDQPQTNPYLRKFLGTIAWKPQQLAVFAGKIDYPRYGFLDRQMIRLIMWMTHGPTQRDAVVEFTNWERVEAFGAAFARAALRSGSAAPAG